MTTHTPGPWTVTFKAGSFVIRNDIMPWSIGQIYDEPNARLIAAAPDLLAALDGLLDVLENAGFETEIMNDARAAVAKATGDA